MTNNIADLLIELSQECTGDLTEIRLMPVEKLSPAAPFWASENKQWAKDFVALGSFDDEGLGVLEVVLEYLRRRLGSVEFCVKRRWRGANDGVIGLRAFWRRRNNGGEGIAGKNANNCCSKRADKQLELIRSATHSSKAARASAPPLGLIFLGRGKTLSIQNCHVLHR